MTHHFLTSCSFKGDALLHRFIRSTYMISSDPLAPLKLAPKHMQNKIPDGRNGDSSAIMPFPWLQVSLLFLDGALRGVRTQRGADKRQVTSAGSRRSRPRDPICTHPSKGQDTAANQAADDLPSTAGHGKSMSSSTFL